MITNPDILNDFGTVCDGPELFIDMIFVLPDLFRIIS